VKIKAKNCVIDFTCGENKKTGNLFDPLLHNFNEEGSRNPVFLLLKRCTLPAAAARLNHRTLESAWSGALHIPQSRNSAGKPFSLAFKKNFEFYPDTPIRNSDDFSGCHNGFLGSGEYECHRYFLSGNKGPAGFDKSPAGTHILNKSIKVAIYCPAKGDNRLDFVEPLPCIPPSFKII